MSATVDWGQWMQSTPEEREATLRRYREIVKSESDQARLSNYARMNAAISGRPG